MSPGLLLVLASVAAALAFLGAGLLLGRARRTPPAEKDGGPTGSASLEHEVGRLRAEKERIAETLAESQRRCQAEADAKKREEVGRLSAEKHRENAQAEISRLADREKVLGERLRLAEAHTRATLDQVESSAAAWEAQWQNAKASHQQREQALQDELDQLRARLDVQDGENQRLTAACQQHAADALEARRGADQARLARTHAERDVQGRSEDWQRMLEQREAEWRARVADTEAAWRSKADALEASWQAKAAAIEQANQVGQSALRSEAQRLAEQASQLRDDAERERDQKQRLALALRTADEALVAEQAQARSAREALAAAENRLREADRLARENAELRDERSRLTEAARLTSENEAGTKDAKVDLAAAQAKLAEMERILAENRRLRDEVAELGAHRQASDDLERLTAAHKQLRLDAELMARRLQELQHDRAELVPLRAQAAEAASLAEEVEYLRRREKDLEAQIYARGFFASREMPAVSGELLVQTPVSDMETNLDSLVGQGGPRTAVLADAQGFLIAGAGESVAQEGLAAFAAVAGEMASRTRMLLPLAEVASVRVTDANSMVLTCHLFESEGTGLGVATLGPGEPPPENTQRAIVDLAAILASGQDGGSTPEQKPPVSPSDDGSPDDAG